jgi:nicotinate-nucleotide adenylyltransferase
MVQLAIVDMPEFVLSRLDIDRPPPHYAVDTMSLMREQSSKNDYYYIMGLDSLNDLPAWHEPAEFVSLCKRIVVMLRQGEKVDMPNLEADLPGIASKVRFLQSPLIEISGTDIRKRARLGKPFRYFVPDTVYNYIIDNQLYQT